MSRSSKTEEELFVEAMEKPSRLERDAFLREECGDDAALRQRLERLLQSHDQAGSFLEGPVIPTLSDSVLRLSPVPVPESAPGKSTSVQFDTVDGQNDGSASESGSAAQGSKPSVPGYEILEELGQGGMGIVYKARHLGLKRLVAIKMILAGSHPGREELERFHAEAEAVARLEHPNIVHIYDVGTANGQPYFSLELVEGESLESRLSGTPLKPLQAASLVATLAEAIHVAHQNGIVHRDLKPDNVLLRGRSGDPIEKTIPKIMDFGLVKKLEDNSQHTRTGMVMGTPSYMAPEQAAGEVHLISPATDVYALGAILYQALTGRPPFRANSPWDTVLQVIHDDPVAPSRLVSRIPRDLETICLKCLQKRAVDRYPTAKALEEDLKRFLADEPIQARPVSVMKRAWKWLKKRPTLTTWIGIVFALILMVVGGFQWNLRRQEKQFEELKAQAGRLLKQGEKALADENYAKAEGPLSTVVTLTQQEPRLKDLYDRARDRWAVARASLLKAKARETAQRQSQEFWSHYDRALFRSTLFQQRKSEGLGEGVVASAHEALAALGMDLSSSKSLLLRGEHPLAEKARLEQGCYEILLTLAEITGQSAPGNEDVRRKERLEKALDILGAADRLIPGKAAIAHRSLQARYLEELGRKKEALEVLQQAMHLEPTSTDHFQNGLTRFLQGNMQGAIVGLERSLRPGVDLFWPDYLLGLCYLRLQQWERAWTHFTLCIRRRPDLSWPYMLRGMASQEVKQFESAERDFEQALHFHDPEDLEAIWALHNNRGALRFQRYLQWRAQVLGMASRSVSLSAPGAVLLWPSVELKRLPLAEQAEKDLRTAIELRKNERQPYVNLAMLCLVQRRHPEAEQLLQTALRLTPKNQRGERAALYYQQGRLQYYRGEYRKALKTLDQAVKQKPDSAEAHRLRAWCLLRSPMPFTLSREEWYRNRDQQAIQAIDLALNHGPKDFELFHERARARARLKDVPGAIGDLSRALQIRKTARALCDRGWLYVNEKAMRLALADFTRATRIEPRWADAYAGYGYVLTHLGRYREATQKAEQAVRLGATPDIVVKATRIYARAASLAKADSRLMPDDAARAFDKLADRAVVLLEMAMSQIPAQQRARFWRRYISQDRALKPLESHPGFQRLLRKYRPRTIGS